jgi:hypothetical protein
MSFLHVMVCVSWHAEYGDCKVMGGINSMAQYQRYFGMTGVGSKTRCVGDVQCIWGSKRRHLFHLLLCNQHRLWHLHCVRPLYLPCKIRVGCSFIFKWLYLVRGILSHVLICF